MPASPPRLTNTGLVAGRQYALGVPVDPLDAAGALVWRMEQGRLEVLVVHRPRYNDWSWPKGKAKPGEALAVCAWREVYEETGRQVILGRPLPGVTYPLRSGRLKKVRYWAGRVATDDDAPAVLARPPVAIASPREIDRIEWLSVERAMRRLTQPSDRLPLVKLLKHFHKGTLETRAIVVLRHAQAVPRAKWSKGEASRPLTARGRAAARAALTGVAAYGPLQVITSPWARCLTTVRPYARRARLPAKTDRWLTEADAARRPERAEHLMDRILAGRDSTVVCSHRPVLPLLLGRLASQVRPKALAKLKAAPLRPGEAVVIHQVARGHRRGRIAAIERLGP